MGPVNARYSEDPLPIGGFLRCLDLGFEQLVTFSSHTIARSQVVGDNGEKTREYAITPEGDIQFSIEKPKDYGRDEQMSFYTIVSYFPAHFFAPTTLPANRASLVRRFRHRTHGQIVHPMRPGALLSESVKLLKGTVGILIPSKVE